MKYGYTIAVGDVKGYPCLRSGELKANLREAVELQADTVEIHLPDPQVLCLEEIKTQTEGVLSVSALGTGLSCGKYGLSLTSPDPAVCEKTQQKLREYIDAAEQLSASVIIGSIRGKNQQNLSFEEYEALYIRNLEPVISYAAEHHTELVLETINRYELPFYNCIEAMAKLVRKINQPNVKVHIDTFHMNIEETDVYRSVAGLKGILGHIHMADNTRLVPGTGTFNFKALKDGLKKTGYEGSLSMECFNPENSREAINIGLTYMKQL